MITFKMDFDADGIRKKMAEAARRVVVDKLAAAGLYGRVKVTFTDGPDGFPSDVRLEGSDEDIAKAREALGIKTGS